MKENNVARNIVKHRLKCAAADIFDKNEYTSEREQLETLLKSSSETGESNSVLLIGPRGSGKTTLIQEMLTRFLQVSTFAENTRLVVLNGNIHINDRIALKSITIQLGLATATEGKTFGSFAENLAFLLECLRAGGKERSKCAVFILDEFDLFCSHTNQTLLYNLFDVAQSAQAPICVVGLTHRLDVVDLLEKRVKSRFSHRQIFLYPKDDVETAISRTLRMLVLPDKPTKPPKIPESFLKNRELTFLRHQFEYTPSLAAAKWNQKIKKLFNEHEVASLLEPYFELNHSLTHCKNLAFEIASLEPLSNEKMKELLEERLAVYTVKLICSLSALEVALLIAIKHHTDIYDGDPFNFEMIFGRFMKFANAGTSMQGLERTTISKAFEHLKKLELIAPVSATKTQSTFQLHRTLVRSNDIKSAVAAYQNIPTEVLQWATNSVG